MRPGYRKLTTRLGPRLAGEMEHGFMGRITKLAGIALGAVLTVSGLAAGATAASAAPQACGGTGSVTTVNGTLKDGATYQLQCPNGAWNGTLLLYSHGYVVPGSANPATDVGDPLTGAFLLAHGFALAGSSYAATGRGLPQGRPRLGKAAPPERVGALAGRHHHRRADPGLPEPVQRRAAHVRRAVRRRGHVEHRARRSVRLPAAARAEHPGRQHHQPDG